MSDSHESIVQVPRNYPDVAGVRLETEFEKFLENPTTQSMEVITGLIALGTRQGLVAVGRIAQAVFKGKMYEQMAEEWRQLRKAGKMPENIGREKRGLYTWAELMKIIDDDCPDEDRLEALKAAFYGVNRVKEGDSEKILEYQLWQITKELTSGDVLLLKAIHERVNTPQGNKANEWEKNIADQTGFGLVELVQRHEKHLVDLLLLTKRGGYDNNAISVTNNRLTYLGVQLCKNIEQYRLDLNSSFSEGS